MGEGRLNHEENIMNIFMGATLSFNAVSAPKMRASNLLKKKKQHNGWNPKSALHRQSHCAIIFLQRFMNAEVGEAKPDRKSET